MRRVITHTSVSATGEASVLSIAAPGHVVYLAVNGQIALEVSSRCDTCPFAFTQLLNSPSVQLGEVIDVLRKGMDEIPDQAVELVRKGLPAGDYLVALLEVTPHSVAPSEPEDYFTTEQVGIWQSALAVEGGRHHPRTEYYRTFTTPIEPDAIFYEFLVPLHSVTSTARVAEWSERLKRGERPVALALALGEHRQPAVWVGKPRITRHLCVAHYLLDGHHRIAAAAREGLPVRLLTAYALAAPSPPPWAPPDAVTSLFLELHT